MFEPTSLDPATVPDVITEEVMQYSFEGLTRFNDKNQIEPCLAESWDISPDGKVYTFHLRKNVKFHNGRVFAASDVKYSWERALNPHTASAQAANYLDGIVGLKDVVAGKSPDLTGVTVVDDNTLKVQLDRGRAYFTGMLTMPQDYVVCKEAVAKTDYKVTKDSFVGTGPFRLDEYKTGQQLSFAANSDYWDGKPGIDRIEMPVILDPQTAYDNFKTNQVDIYSHIQTTRYAIDRDNKTLQAEYHVGPEAAFSYLGFQENKQPVFKNADVRHAIALALDRPEIIRVAFKSVSTLATGVLPPGVPLSGPVPEQFSFDVKKAQELLAKAGYPGGKGFPSITLTYRQKNPEVESAAIIVRKNLKSNLGIDVTLSAREAGEFYTAENKHALEMWLGGWVADYLDPQDFLSTLFISHNDLNFFDYSNPTFDKLCHEADAITDPAKRSTLYGQAHALLMADMPVVPIHFAPRITLVHTDAKGWRECALYVLPANKATKD